MTKRDESAKKLIAQYQKTFDSPHGQVVLRDLMKVNFILSPTIHEQNSDLTLVHEGQRNAILRIMTILKMDAAAILGTIEEEDSHV